MRPLNILTDSGCGEDPRSGSVERELFRRDVEGLRAVAVLAVLLFHSRWSGTFSGGFIGVDVFFVISGFLITRNILSRAWQGRFSFRDFYVRRIRRLFPALLCTLGCTVVAGLLIASPSELLHISQSALASIFSISNFYFWGQAGYFDSAAIQKPLLHTWSLAVEEQFYLIWPAIVVLMVRYGRNRRSSVVTLVAMAGLSVFAAEVAFRSDPAAVFYLAPYRVNEFAIGAICAYAPARRPFPDRVLDAVAALGLGLILVPVVAYSGATRFPGLNALVPCVGAALLIHFGDSRTARWLLANRVAVGVGRISYSLYLVHWPLFVFLRQLRGEPDTGESLMAFAATLLLATAMYRFVEQPFRMGGALRQAIPTRKFAMVFGGLTGSLAVLAALIWWTQGVTWRFPKELAQLGFEASSEKAARFGPFLKRCLAPGSTSCDEPSDGVNVFIVGDSHSPDAFNALVAQYPDYHYVLHGLEGCAPLVREDFRILRATNPKRGDCIKMNERLLYGTQFARADLVVVSTVFEWYRPEHLGHTVDQIRKQTSAPILVLGNYLSFDEDVPDMIIRHGRTSMDAYYERRLSTRTFAFESELEALSRAKGFIFVSKRGLFCNGPTTLDCPLMFGRKLFTYDQHHLSVAAAEQMGLALKTSSYGQLLAGLGIARQTRLPDRFGYTSASYTSALVLTFDDRSPQGAARRFDPSGRDMGRTARPLAGGRQLPARLPSSLH
jgi:peptidoglycan/LPS O-acetylase OafA/YrhL